MKNKNSFADRRRNCILRERPCAALVFSFILRKGINKSWVQSPYLFPLIVALAMIGLSLWIVGEGVTAMKKEAAVPNDKKVSKAEKTEKRRWVVIALILCVLYYAGTCFIKVPYVTIEFYLLRTHFQHLKL